MSESTTYEEAFVIPELNCDAPFSIAKLPEPSNTTLDTTDLAKYYRMSPLDVSHVWCFSTEESDPGTGSSGSSGTTSTCSDVAYVNSSDDWVSIRWIYRNDEDECEGEANLLSSNGWVISPFAWQCNSANGLMVPAPVTYATNKPSYLPSPVFNPNQSAGGGGTIEGLPPVLGQVVSVNYSKNEATVQLYGLNASGDLVLTDEEVIAIIL